MRCHDRNDKHRRSVTRNAPDAVLIYNQGVMPIQPPTTSDHGFGQKIDLVTVHLATIGGDHKCSQFNFGITML
jgi:hypothetical protein